MEGMHQGILGGVYVGEPQRSCVYIEEEMDLAAVGTQGGR